MLDAALARLQIASMTDEHLGALLAEGNASDGDDGYKQLGEGKKMTLYVSSDGSSLSVGRVCAVKVAGDLLYARTSSDAVYVVPRTFVFAGSVDGAGASNRKAGFR